MAASIPFKLRPLQPTLVRPFHRDGWAFEVKVDGWRIVAYKNGRQVRLVSRNGVDHTARFRDLAPAVAALPDATLILDGEVAVFDERLVSRFDLLSEPDPPCWPPRPSMSRSTCSMPGAGTSARTRWRRAARCWSRSWTAATRYSWSRG